MLGDCRFEDDPANPLKIDLWQGVAVLFADDVVSCFRTMFTFGISHCQAGWDAQRTEYQDLGGGIIIVKTILFIE